MSFVVCTCLSQIPNFIDIECKIQIAEPMRSKDYFTLTITRRNDDLTKKQNKLSQLGLLKDCNLKSLEFLSNC